MVRQRIDNGQPAISDQPPVSILVVDDENFFAEWLAENLRDIPNRYDAHWVNSARAALEFIQQQPVDLVVSDIKMAGTSGLELLKEIRARHPSTGVILMTGYALPELQQEAVKRGSLLLLEKPFPLAALEQAIEQARKTFFVSGPLSVVPGQEDEVSLVPHPLSGVPGQEQEVSAGPRGQEQEVSPETRDRGPGLTREGGDQSPALRFSDEEQRELRECLAASEHLEGGALIAMLEAEDQERAGEKGEKGEREKVLSPLFPFSLSPFLPLSHPILLSSTLPEAQLSSAVVTLACAWLRISGRLSEDLGRGEAHQVVIQAAMGNIILCPLSAGSRRRPLSVAKDNSSVVSSRSSVVEEHVAATTSLTTDKGPRTTDNLFVLFVSGARSKLGLALLQARGRAQKISQIIDQRPPTKGQPETQGPKTR